MTIVESWILAYLLNSLWQAPLVFCAAWCAARLARPAGPRAEHAVWAGAMMLMAALPATNAHAGEVLRHAWHLVLWFRSGPQTNGEARILIGPASAVAAPWISAKLLAAVAALYCGSILYFAVRLWRGLANVRSVCRDARTCQLPVDTAQSVNRLLRPFALRPERVRLAFSGRISGPATVGLRRRTLLLPPGFLEQLDPASLDALLAHEFAHMRRWDFAKNLVYNLLTLAVAYHPALWLARTRLDESRELVCDEIASEVLGARNLYARSLLSLASMLGGRRRPAILHAIGILDANTFERRVMHLTHIRVPVARFHRILIAAACALLAVVTSASAVALRVGVADGQNSADSAKAPKRVKSNDLKIVRDVMPEYPQKAKDDKVSGEVDLDVVVGKDGSVENIKVVTSLRDDCDQAAIDAVRQWKFEPVLQDGEPIEVLTKIAINFQLKK